MEFIFLGVFYLYFILFLLDHDHPVQGCSGTMMENVISLTLSSLLFVPRPT